jgi:hypothetical protein
MNLALIIITLFNALSIGFLGLCLLRLRDYGKKYKLKENHHTLLFGFVSMKHIIMLYIAGVAFVTCAGYAFVFYLSSR